MKENATKTTKKSTTEEQRSSTTGLTERQEKAAVLLANGVTVCNVAQQLGIDRTTLYRWQKDIAFDCFYNLQREESRTNLINGMHSLVDEALGAVRGALQSDNDTVKIKAAMWVIEKVERETIGQTDVRAALEQKHTFNPLDWRVDETVDTDAVERELRAMGIKG